MLKIILTWLNGWLHYTILQSRKIEGGSECICAKYGWMGDSNTADFGVFINGYFAPWTELENFNRVPS